MRRDGVTRECVRCAWLNVFMPRHLLDGLNSFRTFSNRWTLTTALNRVGQNREIVRATLDAEFFLHFFLFFFFFCEMFANMLFFQQHNSHVFSVLLAGLLILYNRPSARSAHQARVDSQITYSSNSRAQKSHTPRVCSRVNSIPHL